MQNSILNVPEPKNEPILTYRPGSSERGALEKALGEVYDTPVDIPLIIGGKEIRTGRTAHCVCPHEHGHVLATYHQAGRREVELAVKVAKKAWKNWSEMPWAERAAVFLKAGGAVIRAISNAGQCGDHVESVQECIPGGD